MIPNVVRGSNAVGLMQYLAGPGRANDHTNQHLVAGDQTILMAHGFGQLDAAAATEIGRDLEEPWRLFGVEVTRNVREKDPATGEITTRRVDAHMWHASLSIAAEEGVLSDEEWGAIATDFADEMGFTETSGKAGCRWVAVRHGVSKDNGNDHIHLAVSLVREDGTKASVHNDFKRAQQVCRALEEKYGLARLESRDAGLGARGEKAAERAVAVRAGAPEVGAKRLETVVRAAAVAATDEADFVRRVRDDGVLCRPRFATGRTDVVVGFSVALPGTDGEQPIWFGGGRLARDLTLPRLREGWADSPTDSQSAVDEWRAGNNPWLQSRAAVDKPGPQPQPQPLTGAMWEQYTQDMGILVTRLASVPLEDRSAWAHVARDTAGVFFAWSKKVEKTPGPIADMGRQLARSAHLRAHESKPKPLQLGSMAGAAVLLAQAGSGSDEMATIMLVRQLMRTSFALIDMHRAAGEAARASQLSSTLTRTLERIHEQLPAYTGPTSVNGAPQRHHTSAQEHSTVRFAPSGPVLADTPAESAALPTREVRRTPVFADPSAGQNPAADASTVERPAAVKPEGMSDFVWKTMQGKMQPRTSARGAAEASKAKPTLDAPSRERDGQER